MSSINRFVPGETRKSDFKSLFNQIVAIVEKYNPEDLHISETFNQLKAKQSLADAMIVAERKSVLTASLKTMRDKRNKYVSSIAMLAKAQLNADDEDKISAAEVLLAVTDRIFKNFSRQSFNTQLALVTQFTDEVNADIDLQAAIKLLGIDDVYAKMNALQTTIDTTYNTRRAALSARARMETTKNKRILYAKMSTLFTAIESAAVEYPDLDYETMINELNTEIQAQRTANALRLAAKSDDETSSVSTDNSVDAASAATIEQAS